MPAANVLLVTRCFILDEVGRILFVRRSLTDRWFPGELEAAGGKLEPGQDIAHAAEDEAFQETGLLISPVHRLAYYDSYISTYGPEQYVGMTYVVIFSIARVTAGKITLSHEHDSFVWATVDEALSLRLRFETRKALVALEALLRKEVVSPSGFAR